MRVSDPTFNTGDAKLGLFELFAAIHNGESLELTGLHPYQRAPAVTVLAIMMTALRRYASTPSPVRAGLGTGMATTSRG
jgi:hypothetical protein